MMTKRNLVSIAVVVMLAGQLSLVSAQLQGPVIYRLEGTWDVTLTFSDGSKVKSLLSVMAGRFEGEGPLIHSAELSFTPPNPTLPEQGSWRRIGLRQFVASYMGFAYTDKLEPFGRIGFRQHVIKLSDSGNEFTGEATFEVKDAEGTVLFSDQVKTQGVRQRPEAP